MKVIKYKKGTSGRYKVYLDTGQILQLYEEVILKYELLVKKSIDEELMVCLDRDNQEWDVYYVALNSIKNRIKSVYELKLKLQKKEYPDYLIDKAISRLVQQGYLDDCRYARSYINSMLINSTRGPHKIERELLAKGIDSAIISEELECYTDEDQRIRIHNIIRKGLKANTSRGGIVLRQKIYNDLRNLGYDISLINEVISTYTFEASKDIAEKEYYKLHRKLGRKYTGEELERKIREKLYLKGLIYNKEAD